MRYKSIYLSLAFVICNCAVPAAEEVPCAYESEGPVAEAPPEEPSPELPAVERGPVREYLDTAMIIKGEIIGIRALRPGDAPSDHVIADVETESGNTYEVDLGIASQFHPF